MKKVTLLLVFTLIMVASASALALADVNDGNIARQFVTDSPTDGMYCTESAATLREFGKDEIKTYGVVDPLFKDGGYFVAPSGKAKLRVYVICVDFEDLDGSQRITYGSKANVRSSQSMTYDYSKPETYLHAIFSGADGFDADPRVANFTGTYRTEGLNKLYKDIAMGKMELDVVLVNDYFQDENGNAKWFTLHGGETDYAIQYAAGVEDFRIFARLHQDAINAAYEYLDPDDLEELNWLDDIDFLCTVVPINTFGYRQGLQGGGGIDTAFSFQDQSIMLRDSEYRRPPGVTTKGGRMVGSAIFPSKGAWGYAGGNYGADGGVFRTMAHEMGHGFGLFDDYSYGGQSPLAPGLNVNSGVGSYGFMSGMTSASPDMFAWRKFRMGWIEDDEIVTVMPGETKIVNLRALGSYNDTNDTNPDVTTRMVLIPKEWRTLDTFNNGWNPNKVNYNFFDWFTPVWLGGETHAVKSFPTFYALECRKTLGADYRLAGTSQGTLVTSIANPTWETGHGAGGFKLVSGALRTGGTTTWSDNGIGLTITVLQSNSTYDQVQIAYTGTATGGMSAVRRAYQGNLTLSENYVTPGETFNVDFNLFTLGFIANNDGTAAPSSVTRPATPLGVPGGVAGFAMTVNYDPAAVKYVGGPMPSSPFLSCVAFDTVATGTISIVAVDMDMIRDHILSLKFEVLPEATLANHDITASITKVDLVNYRGVLLPSVDVGTAGSGNTWASNDIKGTGIVKVSADPRYTISGKVTVDTEIVPGVNVAVESVVRLYDGAALISSTKSDDDGNYTLLNVPAGEYKLEVSRHVYVTETLDIEVDDENLTDVDVMLAREKYTVSGTIYGSPNSSGSGSTTPLEGAKVEIMDCGMFPLGPAVYTNASGQYTALVNVEPNTYATLFATKDGYGNSRGPNYGINGNDLFRINTNRTGINRTLTETFNVYIGVNGASSSAVHVAQVRKVADDSAVGGPVNVTTSITGNTSAQTTIPNIPPGEYYIEVSRSGYISLCTTSFTVTSDNVFLARRTYMNTLPSLTSSTASGTYNVSGTVVDLDTREPLAARVQFVSTAIGTSASGGGTGAPITAAANGAFSGYRVLSGTNELIVSMPGYKTKVITITSATANVGEIELERAGFDDYQPVLKIAKVAVAPGGAADVTYSIEGNSLGFTTLDLELPYDSSIYKPILVTPDASLGHGTSGFFVTNLAFGGKEVLKVTYAGSANVVGDDLVFTVKYEVVAKPAVFDVTLGGTVVKAELGRNDYDFIAIDLQIEEGMLIFGLLGDINGDFEITPEDAILLLQMYVGLIPWTERALLFGDVNGDGVIDSTDAALILRMVVGG
ncbi:MAG: carboxypeptidase regulatory-like domain-containing protein [Clostridiales bacterium]|jgi:hypothetical protein|nr:carboxypeptidase regulatory-like domain-containing protein [Clostridiales bacterium]MDR2711989.1 carboxypeptidase regulatory-like domain-containing protein [Clostridiales bacterium]